MPLFHYIGPDAMRSQHENKIGKGQFPLNLRSLMEIGSQYREFFATAQQMQQQKDAAEKAQVQQQQADTAAKAAEKAQMQQQKATAERVAAAKAAEIVRVQAEIDQVETDQETARDMVEDIKSEQQEIADKRKELTEETQALHQRMTAMVADPVNLDPTALAPVQADFKAKTTELKDLESEDSIRSRLEEAEEARDKHDRCLSALHQQAAEAEQTRKDAAEKVAALTESLDELEQEDGSVSDDDAPDSDASTPDIATGGAAASAAASASAGKPTGGKPTGGKNESNKPTGGKDTSGKDTSGKKEVAPEAFMKEVAKLIRQYQIDFKDAEPNSPAVIAARMVLNAHQVGQFRPKA